MIVPADGRQPMYQQAIRACMSRNRDLNGNGTIEANEVNGIWPLLISIADCGMARVH